MRVWKRIGESGKELSTIEDVKYFLNKENLIECDSETTGLCPHINDIICIQFGNPNEQYLIEWDIKLVDILSPYLNNDKKTYIFHNAAFDLKFLYKYDLIVKNVYDTFLAESVLTMGMLYPRRDLKSLLKKYLNIDISKEVRKDIPRLGLIDEVIDYGLDDVKYLSILKEEQFKIIEEYNLQKALSLENNFVKVLAFMEYWGMEFDKKKWMLNVEENNNIKKDLLNKMNNYIVSNKLRKYYNYAGLFSTSSIIYDNIEYEVTINWSSPIQVASLFTELGFNVKVEEDGEEKDSIGKEFLQKNAKKHELIGYFSDYVKNNKLLSSFGEGYLNFINPVTNKIHTSYKQLVNTGRMSSGNKKDNKPNLQQLPSSEKYRSCFIAPKGYKLIASDYSGMESVVFANKTLDQGLLNFYDTGQEDMHSFIASKCFPNELKGLSLKEIKEKRPDLRQDAKGAGFAIQFGGVGFTISNNLGISPEIGEEVYNNYMEGFPGVRDYFKKVSTESLNNGYITFNEVTNRKFFINFMEEFKQLQLFINNVDWREYRLEKQKDSYKFNFELLPKVKKYFRLKGIIERRSYNYPVQGTSADITKTALLLLWNWIIENNYFKVVNICNVVHDEVIVECPDDLVKIISEKVVECMVKAGKIFYTRVPLNASCEIGDHWLH